MTTILTTVLIAAAAACHPPAGAVVKRQMIPVTAYYLPSEADGWTGVEMPALAGRLCVSW